MYRLTRERTGERERRGRHAGNSTGNSKVYIHEFIDILGHNRAKYMHHMTANWSPIAQAERHQLCYGVWGVVGTTRGWPQVVNIWEEDGFDGLATSFRHEFNHASLQDPEARQVVGGGGVVPPPRHGPGARARALDLDHRAACAPPACTAEVFAHEQVTLPQGGAGDYLEDVAQRAQPLYEEHGWQLVGAWETAMVNETEAFLLWGVPSWEQWASLEKAERMDGPLRSWRQSTYGSSTDFHRFLLVDAPAVPVPHRPAAPGELTARKGGRKIEPARPPRGAATSRRRRRTPQQWRAGRDVYPAAHF